MAYFITVRSRLKSGFWFKIKADVNFKPEVPAKPMPIVVNTVVLQGLDPPYNWQYSFRGRFSRQIRAQREDWAKGRF